MPNDDECFGGQGIRQRAPGIDQHRFDVEAAEIRDRKPRAKKADVNSPILCCQCGAEFFCGTWADTVAAFRVHEASCSR